MANTTLQLRKSGETGNVPPSLAYGELALNYADGKLFYKAANGTITYIQSGGGGGSSSNSFATINVDSSLILATSPTDTLSFVAGNNVTISACTISKTITINSTATGGGGTLDQFARDTANSASSNTVIIQGVDLAQNTTITQVNQYAAGAYSTANLKFDTSGGTITGNVTISANSNLTVTGNLTVNTANVQQLNIAGSAFINTNRTITYYGTTHNQLGSGSGARDIDLRLGNFVSATVAGVTTWTFSNPIASPAVTGFILELTNGGSAALTWPASVKWPGGTAPSLTAAGIDVLTFFTDDGGTTYRGVVSMLDSK